MTTSPFLNLPAELRLLIYSYLRPNIDVSFWLKEYHSSPMLRAGGEACYPAILRVNRLIYHEALPEWYGSVEYGGGAFEDEPELSFLGNQIPLGGPVPQGFREMRRVQIVMDFPLTPRPTDTALLQETDVKRYIGIDTCADIFSSPDARLEMLYVTIHIGDCPFGRLKYHPSEAKKVARWMLSPLLAMRGLTDFSVKGEFWPRLEHMGYGPDHSLIQGFLRAIRECSTEMFTEMGVGHSTQVTQTARG
ncbi:hypothetical protein AOQ84DRAFT_284845 [Glonium stellatum]|uniref:Uncharacterized protein n=1 Tax=Glonium stellatum TaxID=574774 RepID=A0A8E2F9M2_9PEZI|nr:hypothetical protein AOQ84DRAFT_284845 [Glonium stellatum]